MSNKNGALRTTDPVSVTTNIGAAVTFSTTASGGSSGYTYQWQLHKAGTWTNIGLAVAPGYTIARVKAGDSGNQYRVIVRDSKSKNVTSNPATLTIKGKKDIDLSGRIPTGKQSGSYLVDETSSMDRERRLNEQQGHRQLAKVHAREHHPEEPRQSSPEGELQNNILQHPELDNQRFDGIDPNLNPEPPLNTEARREFDNERREQEMEKQLRLGNMPKFSTAPKPQGP